jgi:class 3 adenylate cyclase
MPRPTTFEDLAELTGEAPDELRAWHELGLLPGSRDGALGTDALDRVLLVQFARRRGVTPDAIARSADRLGDVLGRYVQLLGWDEDRSPRSVDELAALSGLDDEFLARVLVASGIPEEGGVFDEDAEALQTLTLAREAGLPDDALLQIVRVLSDSTNRIAETFNRVFHFYVHEQLRIDGLSGAELTETTEAIGQPLLSLVEPALLYYFRKAWVRAVREDLLLHLAEDVTPPGDAIGQVQVTVLFVDLAGFTPLTEVMGDTAAAGVLERFSDLVRHAALETDGRIVKQMGDEFMIVFSDARDAVTCGLDITARVGAEHEFPGVRLGAHAGLALYREGDYAGATVNVAARVAGQAGAGQFLVTSSVRSGAAELDDVEFTPAGARELKGVADRLELSVVIRPTGTGPARITDPVCGMQLDPRLCETRLSWRGHQLLFCSERCLQRFTADPDRYHLSARTENPEIGV